MEQQVIGLDVSKAWLDGYLSASGRRLRVGNDAAGVRALVRSLGERAACLVVMEASGGYERTAHQELVAQGVLAAIVNPKARSSPPTGTRLRPRHGPGSQDRPGRRQVIARYGEVRRPAATPIADPARAELGEILACRRRLIDEITVRRQQLEHLHSPAMRARVAKVLAFLRQEERELDRLQRATTLKGALTLEVYLANPGARRFYDRCGFVPIAHREVDDDGRPWPVVVMSGPPSP